MRNRLARSRRSTTSPSIAALIRQPAQNIGINRPTVALNVKPNDADENPARK